jgi:hypothetical protein
VSIHFLIKCILNKIILNSSGSGLNFVELDDDCYFDLLKNPETYNNGSFAAIMPRRRWETAMSTHFRNETILALNYTKMKIFQEDYMTFCSNWNVFSQYYQFYLLLNNFLLELHQHGHLLHLESMENVPKPPKPQNPEPQVLTMYKLSAGFIVWFASFSAAFIVFIAEHIWRYYKVTRHLNRRVIRFIEDLETL